MSFFEASGVWFCFDSFISIAIGANIFEKDQNRSTKNQHAPSHANGHEFCQAKGSATTDSLTEGKKKAEDFHRRAIFDQKEN
jgi:hypothetical protein